jgi:hypothetical protein
MPENGLVETLYSPIFALKAIVNIEKNKANLRHSGAYTWDSGDDHM